MAVPERHTAEVDDRDVATMLSELPTHGTDDYVSMVIRVYQGAMEVYEPSEQRYQEAVEAQTPRIRSSTSANW